MVRERGAVHRRVVTVDDMILDEARPGPSVMPRGVAAIRATPPGLAFYFLSLRSSLRSAAWTGWAGYIGITTDLQSRIRSMCRHRNGLPAPGLPVLQKLASRSGNGEQVDPAVVDQLTDLVVPE